MDDPQSTAADEPPRTESFSVLAITSHRPAEMTTSLAEMSAETTVLDLDSSGSRLRRALDNYRRIRRAMATHDPDLLLLDCYEIPGAIVAALAMRDDVALVARLVGDTWRGYETPLRSVESVSDFRRFVEHRASYGLNSFVFGQADGYVGVSTELREIIHRRTGCPRDRIGVVPVPLTVDTRKEGMPERIRESLGIEEQQIVLTVTNLTFREKFEGVTTVLRELRPLLEANPDLAYVVAGDGRFLEQLRETVAEEITDPSARERIYTPGHVEHVADLYALADVFAYVSYRDGYPNAVLEAQTAELPVVANAAHGMCDQISDGETGYLVDPGESGALRARVTELLASPEQRQQIGRQARQRVLAENTSAAVSQKLESFLARFLAEYRRTKAHESGPSNGYSESSSG